MCGAPNSRQINSNLFYSNTFITAHLEFYSIRIFLNIKRTETVHHDGSNEGLDSLVEVSCGSMSVLSNKLMFCGVSREVIFNRHPIYLNLFLASSVAVSDGLI